MKMTNKIKALLMSVATIVVCICVMTGATFALFTDEERVNIVVEAAEVSLDASVTGIRVTSMEDYVDDTPDAEGYYTFEVGGTAVFDETNGEITVDRMAPGDAVEFIIENDLGSTNIAVAYRVKFSIEVTNFDGTAFENADKIKAYVNLAPDESDPYARDKFVQFTKADGEEVYSTEWSDSIAPGEDINDIVIRFEMDETAGNEYQKVSIVATCVVEIVQYNGVDKM